MAKIKSGITEVVRTDGRHPAFVDLVGLLNEELKIYDGEQHDFYQQYNGIESIDHVVMARVGEAFVGCGAIKHFSPDQAEVKRMYVVEEVRSQGIAGEILSELESWAREWGYSRCILETGRTQRPAIRLYTRLGYSEIPNYGPYEGIDASVCFAKVL